MGDRLGGEFEIKCNGKTIRAVGTFTFTHGGEQREGQVSSRAVDGFTSKERIPGAKGQMRDYKGINTKEDITKIDNATFTAKAGNGKTFILEGAWYSGNGEIDLDMGVINFEFQGIDSDEITA
jgi:hypothetical protein